MNFIPYDIILIISSFLDLKDVFNLELLLMLDNKDKLKYLKYYNIRKFLLFKKYLLKKIKERKQKKNPWYFDGIPSYINGIYEGIIYDEESYYTDRNF